MTDLSAFPVSKRWPAHHPERLQLYSLPTPNGVTVSIMLEEIGLPYEAHLVDFGKGDQRTPEYLSLNPYGKIPAIIDPAGPGGKSLPLFESGAILLYLAEKTGKLMPADPAGRYETLEWLFFQMAAMGPMFGQVGYFHKFAGREIEDKRPLHRYRDEAKRILAIIEARLAERSWIMGDDYTIADISMLGWVRNLIGFTRRVNSSTSRRSSIRPPGLNAALRGPLFSAGSTFRRAWVADNPPLKRADRHKRPVLKAANARSPGRRLRSLVRQPAARDCPR
jgi:GSH-dependent disulfide-bond oxidoreductase